MKMEMETGIQILLVLFLRRTPIHFLWEPFSDSLPENQKGIKGEAEGREGEKREERAMTIPLQKRLIPEVITVLPSRYVSKGLNDV